jgi:hypothetical protein
VRDESAAARVLVSNRSGPGSTNLGSWQRAIIRSAKILRVAIPTNEPPTQFFKEGTGHIIGLRDHHARTDTLRQATTGNTRRPLS